MKTSQDSIPRSRKIRSESSLDRITIVLTDYFHCFELLSIAALSSCTPYQNRCVCFYAKDGL